MGRKKKIKKIVRGRKKRIVLKKPLTRSTYKSNVFKTNDIKAKIKKVLKQPT